MTCELCCGTGTVRWISENGSRWPVGPESERFDFYPDSETACPSCDGHGSYDTSPVSQTDGASK